MATAPETAFHGTAPIITIPQVRLLRTCGDGQVQLREASGWRAFLGSTIAPEDARRISAAEADDYVRCVTDARAAR